MRAPDRQEDQLLSRMVLAQGTKHWSRVAQGVPGRLLPYMIPNLISLTKKGVYFYSEYKKERYRHHCAPLGYKAKKRTRTWAECVVRTRLLVPHAPWP